MQDKEYSTYTAEEISRLILQTPADQIKPIIPSLSPEQIAAILVTLDKNRDEHWREKLVAIIKELNDIKHLEAAGHALSLLQALHLLDESIKSDHNGHWKLSPLLVGMSHRLFTHMLLSASTEQMNALKQEVITESVQHHLTVLTHEILHQIPEFAAKVDDLEQEIDLLNPAEMGHSDLKKIVHRIEECAEYYEQTINKINKVLALAWNTNRTDLIEKLSMAKEISQKLVGSLVGSRRTIAAEPTGLFAKLEERLNRVYGISTDPQDIEALENDEPAIEALVKFSIWYLRDYWEIGLLPNITNAEEVELETSHSPNDQKMIFREKIYDKVNSNLSKLGLNTVRDLKEAKIFSKETLVDYIAKNVHLIH